MPTLNLLPDTLDLAIYAGDGVMLKLTVTDNAEVALPVDGEVLAQIRAKRLDEAPLAEFAVDLVQAADGFIFISLTGEQTASLIPDKKVVFKGVWDVQYKKTGAEPITLLQGKVECSADVSR